MPMKYTGNSLPGATTPGLKHLSQTCPVQQKWDVERMSFHTLFSKATHFNIPIFQRKYCWEDKQITKWFQDLLHAPGEYVVGHSVGKVMLKQEQSKDALLLLDGQQRVTTTSLFLASLRDAALKTSINMRVDAAIQEKTNRIVKEIESSLYTVTVGKEDIQGLVESHQNMAEGEIAPFCRLTPSFQDRFPFYYLITTGRLGNAPANPLADESNHLVRTKLQFDRFVSAHLETQADPLAEIQRLLHRSLDFFSVMFMEFTNEANLPQLFLWMQEKALFSMGAILYNPAPGVKFSACDLVRNLLMSTFSTSSYGEQEEFYINFWVPLERKHPDIEEFDSHLLKFVVCKAEVPPYVSKFESEITQMAVEISRTMGREETMAKLKGVMGYAVFYSYYERRLQSAGGDAPGLAKTLLRELEMAQD